ncbi:putative site-specific integrase-resolvase [Bradyrhizobium sp. USDA 4509]
MSDVISINATKPVAPQGPLLVSRKAAQQMLGGISVSHLRRLMKAGEIHPVFLNSSRSPQRSGKLFFRVSDLEALVEKFAKHSVK